MLGTILIISLILLLIGALPTWGYSRGFGYFPSGILGVVLVVIYVERGEFIRLISARKATRLEEHDHLKERWAGPD